MSVGEPSPKVVHCEGVGHIIQVRLRNLSLPELYQEGPLVPAIIERALAEFWEVRTLIPIAGQQRFLVPRADLLGTTEASDGLGVGSEVSEAVVVFLFFVVLILIFGLAIGWQLFRP